MIGSQKGFTLVELVISLTVIALITLGVMKGMSLIENTKINNLIKEFEYYERAVSLYTVSVRKVPGSSFSGDYITPQNFWRELRAQGVIEGDPSDGNSPVHALANSEDDIFMVSQITMGERRPMLFCAKNIKREYAQGIDQNIDDGNTAYLSGHVYLGSFAGYDTGQPFVTLCKEFIVSHKIKS